MKKIGGKKLPSRDWGQRSAIIFFHLHDKLGNNDYSITTRVCSVKKCALQFIVGIAIGVNSNRNYGVDTLKQWLYKMSYISTWVPFCETMTVGRVVDALQPGFRQAFASVDQRSGLGHRLAPFKEKVDSSKFTQTRLVHGGLSTRSTQAKVAMGRFNGEFEFVSATKKRIKGGGPPSKYPDVKEWVLKCAERHWFSGDLLTMDRLVDLLHAEFKKGSFAVNLLDSSKPTYPETVRKWLSRLLKKYRWTLRGKTISQEIPKGWDVLARKNSQEICDLILSVNADAVVAADEVGAASGGVAIRGEH